MHRPLPEIRSREGASELTMPIITFDLPPIQDEFAEDDVRNMDVGRRQLRTEWAKTLYKPDSPENDWCLILPFPNTYQNAYFSMCDVHAHQHQAATGNSASFSGESALTRSHRSR